MIRISSRAAGCAAAFFSLLVADVTHAAPLYVAWEQLFDDTANVSQFPHAVALDSRGNVFVTGHTIVGAAKGFYTAKYDVLDGHLVWSKALNGAGTNEFIANAIAVDSNGDCAVTGSRNVAGSIDYYTVKYSGSDGTLIWQKSYNGPNDGEDTALKVVCDHANNVIVTGRSVGKNASNSTGFDFATIKYAQADGTQLAINRYTASPSNFDDVPSGIAVDSNNNVFVVGTSVPASGEARFYIQKLQASNLAKLWDDTENTGDESGAAAVAVGTDQSVVATGIYNDGSNHFGFYTAKYTNGGGMVWQTGSPPVSEDTFGFPRPAPVGVAIGPDNSPIVTGTLLDASGTRFIRTIKYTPGGFFNNAMESWIAPSVDTGFGSGDTSARAITVDDAGNAIVVGDSTNTAFDTDLYVAKYDSQTGQLIQNFAFNGSFNGSSDTGVDVAVDKFGDITALGDLVADKGTGIGLDEFATVKINRLIAPTGDDLPNGAKVSVAGLPAVSDSGTLAARLTFKSGSKPGNAILVEGSSAGGTLLPAVQGQSAPVAVGDPTAKWASFSDPVVAPDGTYAFAAKVSGAATKANGVWTNMSGSLALALRQGSVVPGTSDKLATVMSLAMENNALVALVKLTGSPAASTALVRLDSANNGTLLLRTGQSGLMINGTDFTVKAITVLSPAPLEAGDGRWQGSLGVVARVAAVETSNPKVKGSAIVAINNGGTKSVVFYTSQAAAAPIATGTYSGFGLPSTAFGTAYFTVKATLTPETAASNSALIYSAFGSAFNAYAQKGGAVGVFGLPSGLTFADFSDPMVNTNALVSYIATLKGSAAKPTSNKAIVFANPMGIQVSVARTGDFAPDTDGNPSTLKWTAFTALALPGPSAGPIFVGKLNTAKNNLGLWAYDSTGTVRRLLQAGDKLGTQVVKKFTLLTAVSKATSAPRSFDTAGSVAVALTFTDGTTALQRIGIP